MLRVGEVRLGVEGVFVGLFLGRGNRAGLLVYGEV